MKASSSFSMKLVWALIFLGSYFFILRPLRTELFNNMIQPRVESYIENRPNIVLIPDNNRYSMALYTTGRPDHTYTYKILFGQFFLFSGFILLVINSFDKYFLWLVVENFVMVILSTALLILALSVSFHFMAVSSLLQHYIHPFLCFLLVPYAWHERRGQSLFSD